MIQLAIT